MVERNGDAQTIFVRETLQFRHKITVIQNVLVAERGAFGEPRGAGGILDVDGVVRRELCLARLERFVTTEILLGP